MGFSKPGQSKILQSKGQTPDNCRRFASNAEWSYSLDLFPAMVRCFRQLAWQGDTSDYTVTWAEIAIDFQASTHCVVQRHHDQSVTLEQQARLFRAAAKSVSQICSAQVVPDLDFKVKVPMRAWIGACQWSSAKTSLPSDRTGAQNPICSSFGPRYQSPRFFLFA